MGIVGGVTLKACLTERRVSEKSKVKQGQLQLMYSSRGYKVRTNRLDLELTTIIVYWNKKFLLNICWILMTEIAEVVNA